VVNEVEAQLKATSDPIARFRLLAIFIISQGGMKPTDQGRLFMAANLGPNSNKALQNLEALGLPLVQPMATGRGVGSKLGAEKIVARREVVDSGSEYANSRYACDLMAVLQMMGEGRLSLDEYPSIYPMPDEGMTNNISSVGVASVRSRASKYSKSGKSGTTTVKGGSRQIVFMAGGLCYSELRAAEKLMEDGGPEVIIGSSNFNNPGSFVDDIASLEYGVTRR